MKRAWRCFMLALLILCAWQVAYPSTENEVCSNLLAALPLMFSYVLDYVYEKAANRIDPAEYALEGELGTNRSGEQHATLLSLSSQLLECNGKCLSHRIL